MAVGALALALAGCAPSTTRSTFPPLGRTPQPAGDTTNATKQAVIGALGAAGLQAADAVRTYRPPEGPLLAAAPRSVVQVTLPDDPDHGLIVIYALDSPNAAIAAAEDHAAWVGTGVGSINFAPGTQFVLRTLGSTVISFSWLPANSPDARTSTIASTLETIGAAVEIQALS